MSLETLRDLVIVVYGVLGIVLFIVLIAVALGIYLAVRKLSRAAQDLMADPVRPTLEEVRQTMQNVRGTSEFVADRTVHPVIRTVAAVRGVRRGLGVMAGIRKRDR
ncbi:MAG: hypothetical protein AB7L91_03295 [Dehalococcoidia bacterium]